MTFYSKMSVITLLVVLTGFANAYGRRLVGGETVPTVIHVHAAIFTTWLLAFVAQTVLIAQKRVKLHKKVGQAGVPLALLMLVSGLVTAIAATRMGHTGIPGVEFKDAEGFLLLNVTSVSLFTLLVIAGWHFRARTEIHKRLMLMATVAGLAPPGISRLPGLAGNGPAIAVVVMGFLASGPVYDWIKLGRPHRAYLFSLPLVALILPPTVTIMASTAAWHTIAAWMIGSR